MYWEKLGKVYQPDGQLWWAKSHAMVPLPVLINSEILRVYVSCCDKNGISRVGFVDLNPENPKTIINVAGTPLIDIGENGCFDDNGVVGSSIVLNSNGSKFLYYVGFELCKKIKYRLFTGLAISMQDTDKFTKYMKTPVLDRSDKELFFRCGTYTINDDGVFKMWYVAGSQWEDIAGSAKPVYVIKYLESKDGIKWASEGVTCIETKDDEHGFGRPEVIKENGIYKMTYSIRKRFISSYRLGYAESKDGLVWDRKDDEIGIDVSESGWDSEMICFASTIKINANHYMFYNGNNYGETGFGLAVLKG